MEMNIQSDLLKGLLLIADGAAGTLLIAAGLQAGTPPELWNVEFPEQIAQLHNAYLDAGSKIILTNSFGGSRTKLEKSGMGDRVKELNLSAVTIARQSAAGKAYVAGDIGPTGELMKPMGNLTFERAVEVFYEQAEILEEGGADLIWIETMSDLEEAKAAITAALQASHLPVFCSLSFEKKARTIMGISAQKAAEELWPLGITAIGANCGEGLEMIPEVIRQMKAVIPGAPLIVKPNAGLPRLSEGKTVYNVAPTFFATKMAEFVAQGAQIVGACCGSDPRYISALNKTLAIQK